jgi:hypothetical protein
MLAAGEQEIDGGRSCARAIDRKPVTKCLTKMAAFGMRLEIEQADHIGGRKRWHRSSVIGPRQDCLVDA